MKKIIFTFLTFTFCNSLYAQDFVGKDATLYLNAIVKPVEISEQLQVFAYKNFYTQFDSLTKVLTKEPISKKKAIFKPFQTGPTYNPVSEYSKLVGVEFKVTGVYEEFEKYDHNKGRHFVFELKNDAVGTIFYEYDTRYKLDLELTVVNGLKFPNGYWCNKYTVEIDKFEDKTSYNSPQTSGFSIKKIISKGTTTYYLYVEESGSTLNVDGKGLYLLFDDGTKLNKEDAKIGVSVGNNGSYIYSAFIQLTNEDLEILKSKSLTDNRLYIYDGVVDSESALLIQEYVKCAIDK